MLKVGYPQTLSTTLEALREIDEADSISQDPLIPGKGHELGYFVKNRTTGGDLEQEFGFAPFKVVSIDLSNPEASEWFKQKIIIENTINFGFKGWMADFGKLTSFDLNRLSRT